MQVLDKLNDLPEASSFDLVVVGAGGAGLGAALFAALDGAKVLLVERTAQVGGTTALSAGTTWVPGPHRGIRRWDACRDSPCSSCGNDACVHPCPSLSPVVACS